MSQFTEQIQLNKFNKQRSHTFQELLESLVDHGIDEEKLFVNRLHGRELRSSPIGLSFSLGWLAVAKTDEVVTASGSLEPIDCSRSSNASGGIASEILVKDGEEVKEGQVVMRLDAETTQQRLKALKEPKTEELSIRTEAKRTCSIFC